ncbi:hypothetical protein QQF64_002855 [Cirrhinus molitorella]|uniref:G-protein coupled receptors family 1 profile domain-containing protein n=1 Tax=Cirrhinus molitorella TaxID=172907 RepID=A0ABR3MRB0_9TELE
MMTKLRHPTAKSRDAACRLDRIINESVLLLHRYNRERFAGLRSLPKSRSQLRTGDVLFVNLAVSNLITNCLVDLPETIAHFAKTWLTSKEYCGVTQFSHEISETSSIFTTMFISVYWHQKLVGSIRRGGAPVQMDNLRLVFALLSGSWIASTAFSLPHVFIAEHNANESSEVCEERFASPAAKQTFDGVYLTLANVVPMIGITYATVQIVITLLRSQNRIKDRSKNGTNPPPSSVGPKLEGTAEPQHRSLFGKISDLQIQSDLEQPHSGGQKRGCGRNHLHLLLVNSPHSPHLQQLQRFSPGCETDQLHRSFLRLFRPVCLLARREETRLLVHPGKLLVHVADCTESLTRFRNKNISICANA